MKRFILAAALALVGVTGSSGKADAQLFYPGYAFPGGGSVWTGGYGFYTPGFSVSFGSPGYYGSSGWGYNPYYAGYYSGYRPYYGGYRYYGGYGGYRGGYYGGYRGWRRW